MCGHCVVRFIPVIASNAVIGIGYIVLGIGRVNRRCVTGCAYMVDTLFYRYGVYLVSRVGHGSRDESGSDGTDTNRLEPLNNPVTWAVGGDG